MLLLSTPRPYQRDPANQCQVMPLKSSEGGRTPGSGRIEAVEHIVARARARARAIRSEWREAFYREELLE